MASRTGKAGVGSNARAPPPSSPISPRQTRGKDPTLKDIMDRLALNDESGKEHAGVMDVRLDEISGKLDGFKQDHDKLSETVTKVKADVTQVARLIKSHDIKIAVLEKKVELHERERRQLNLVLDGVPEERDIALSDVVNKLFDDLKVGFTIEVCERIYRRGKKSLGNTNAQTPPPSANCCHICASRTQGARLPKFEESNWD